MGSFCIEKNFSKKFFTFESNRSTIVLVREQNNAPKHKFKEDKSMKYDIKVVGNGIGGRQGFAYVCNSGEIKVLEANLEQEQEYTDYATYGKAKLAWNYRDRKHYKPCQLAFNQGKWEFASHGACISGSFGYHDAMESIREAQLQTLDEGDIVAIAQYTPKNVFLQLFKLGKVNINCMTAASLIPLTDEEMTEVVKNAKRWMSY